MDQTGARINVPPPSVMKNEIVVSGEKDGVHQAVTSIMKMYDEKVSVNYHMDLSGKAMNLYSTKLSGS